MLGLAETHKSISQIMPPGTLRLFMPWVTRVLDAGGAIYAGVVLLGPRSAGLLLLLMFIP